MRKDLHHLIRKSEEEDELAKSATQGFTEFLSASLTVTEAYMLTSSVYYLLLESLAAGADYHDWGDFGTKLQDANNLGTQFVVRSINGGLVMILMPLTLWGLKNLQDRWRTKSRCIPLADAMELWVAVTPVTLAWGWKDVIMASVNYVGTDWDRAFLGRLTLPMTLP